MSADGWRAALYFYTVTRPGRVVLRFGLSQRHRARHQLPPAEHAREGADSSVTRGPSHRDGLPRSRGSGDPRRGDAPGSEECLDADRWTRTSSISSTSPSIWVYQATPTVNISSVSGAPDATVKSAAASAMRDVIGETPTTRRGGEKAAEIETETHALAPGILNAYDAGGQSRSLSCKL